MVVHWTDEADVKLFIAVLKIHSVKLNYEALAAAMGPDVTPKAITQRIAKLRAKAAASASSAVAGEDGIAPEKAATKTAGAATKKRAREAEKVTGKKRKLGGNEFCAKREDDEEEFGKGSDDGDGEGGMGLGDAGQEGGVVRVKGEEGGA